ncbi:hypothetical protein AHAS_Ahas02G0191800 [Arachis hypogaea]
MVDNVIMEMIGQTRREMAMTTIGLNKSDLLSRFMGSMEHDKCLNKAAVETDFDRIKDLPNPWKFCTFATVSNKHHLHRFGSGVRRHHRLIRKKVHQTRTPIPRTSTDRHWPHHLHCVHGCGGILEVVRLNMVRIKNYYDLETIPLSIFWQVLQYVLIGAVGVFVNIGQMEFFYGEAPDAIRSLCSGLSLTTNALGNYFSTFLVTIVMKVTTGHGRLGWIPDNLNRGHLDYFFTSIGF